VLARSVAEEDDARLGSPLCVPSAPSLVQEEKSVVDDTRMSSHLITLSEDKERGELRRHQEEGDNVLHMTDGSQCQYDTPVKVSKDLWRVKDTMCNGRATRRSHRGIGGIQGYHGHFL
jgi:hypothetical protein